ncbi:MAG TPA: VOC family protein [Bosea sp. (in: a-proteobacteria)]
MARLQKITPFLWFDKQAEEAADFYVSVFRNSRKGAIMRNPGDVSGLAAGDALTVSFTLEGMDFTAMNGGPGHDFSDAVSFVVLCDTQDEVDHYWDRLTADGGKPIACGWLKDKFGVSWQITPGRLIALLTHSDTATASRVMQAMMQMIKLDIAALERAAAG